MDGHDPGLYGRSFADVYDHWYRRFGSPGRVVAAIESRARPGGWVLELGSGTGRVSGPLCSAGFRVIGLDASIPMLRADRSGARRVAADMARLPLRAGSVDVIVVAFNTLFNLVTAKARRQALRDMATVLRPGGVVAIEGFIAAAVEGRPRFDLATRPADDESGDGPTVIATERRPDLIRGVHLELRPDGLRARPWMLGYCTPDVLAEEATAAGLTVSARHADWTGAGFDPSGSSYVLWFRR